MESRDMNAADLPDEWAPDASAWTIEQRIAIAIFYAVAPGPFRDEWETEAWAECVGRMLVGWGDVSTAYHSTGIPNIETYMVFPQGIIKFLRASQLLGFLLYTRPVKNILKFAVNNLFPPGPSEARRDKGLAIIIGEVTDAEGRRAVSRLQTREGYSFTAQATVEIMKRILSSDYKTGFQTPSLVYGQDFILQFDGTKRTDE